MGIPICIRHAKSKTALLSSGTGLETEELKLLFKKIQVFGWNLIDLEIDDFTLDLEDELEDWTLIKIEG